MSTPTPSLRPAPPPALRGAPPPLPPSEGVLLSSVTPQPVRWLWPGRVPLGKVTVLDGDPAVGKSLITLDLAARVSTARPMPDGSMPDFDGPAGVVLVGAEDDIADTIRPRLDAAGADATRVYALTGAVDVHNGKRVVRPPTIADYGALLDAVSRVRARLLVIDPIAAHWPSEVDTAVDADVRPPLAGLARFAGDSDVAVVLVRHLRKSRAGAGAALYAGGGSIGIIASARSGLLAAEDPNDDDRRVLVCTKATRGRRPEALAYQISAVEVPGAGRVERVEWIGPVEMSAEEVLAPRQEKGAAAASAAEWLRDRLAAGPVPAETLRRDAAAAGHSWGTLRRARAAAGAMSKRRGFGEAGGWIWTLAGGDAVGCEAASGPPIDAQQAIICAPMVKAALDKGSTIDAQQAIICAPMGGGGPGPSPCGACGGPFLWRSTRGQLVCETCHPPADNSFVAGFVTAGVAVQ